MEVDRLEPRAVVKIRGIYPCQGKGCCALVPGPIYKPAIRSGLLLENPMSLRFQPGRVLHDHAVLAPCLRGRSLERKTQPACQDEAKDNLGLDSTASFQSLLPNMRWQDSHSVIALMCSYSTSVTSASPNTFSTYSPVLSEHIATMPSG